MRKIVAFDFDGTLTTRDTLLAFIRYACGSWAFAMGFLLHSPLLVLMKLGLFYTVAALLVGWLLMLVINKIPKPKL